VNWINFGFTRTAASVANGGTGEPTGTSPQAYVPQIVPFPRTAPNAFPFYSLDSASLTRLYVGGTFPYDLPSPSPLQLAIYESAYTAGMSESVALLGGAPGTPPDNTYQCLDGPQDSITELTYLKTPLTAGIYPRWTIFTSAADSFDGSVSRIVDLQCVDVGSATFTDADNDCLDPNLLAGATGPDFNLQMLALSKTGNTARVLEVIRNRGASFTGTLKNKFTSSSTNIDFSTDCAITSVNANGATGGPFAMDGSTTSAQFVGTFTGTIPTNGVVIKILTCTHTSLSIVDVTNEVNPGGAVTEDAGAPANNSLTVALGKALAGADAGDTNDGSADQDGDGVVDGIEAASGSNMNGSDTDADGSLDYAELFQFSNPNDADTDDDGSLDKIDNGADEDGASPTIITDGTTDDNCPAAANADQKNTDFENTYHGIATTGDSTGNTNPDQDVLGDACDTDKDNDNMVNVAEDLVTIIDWAGPGSVQCKGPGTAGSYPPTITINPLIGDSDGDMALDGIECQQSARPDITCADPLKCPALPASRVAPCKASPLDVRGCALPPNAAAGEDPDADGLYAPGAAANNNVETFYRTQGINLSSVLQAADTDGDTVAGNADKDSDADWCKAGPPCAATVILQDGGEVRYYGTDPSNADTDGDGCDDSREVIDVTGDRTVTSGDQGLWASKKISDPDAGKLDPDGDGVVKLNLINFDFNKNRTLDSGDQGMMTAIILNSKPCATALQVGKTIGQQYKVAPAN
jgi:hypothetical protein